MDARGCEKETMRTTGVVNARALKNLAAAAATMPMARFARSALLAPCIFFVGFSSRLSLVLRDHRSTNLSYDTSSTLRIHVTLALSSNFYRYALTATTRSGRLYAFANRRDALGPFDCRYVASTKTYA